ncbi:hypothetical protein ACFPIJ_60615 [Dactylosporangium cerinum]|uniref:CU044_5270 family protein n=1 Tax=Dactylosporangium cerinum TaxID=1434730 RepID=A0ABV9WGX6_9ACTN
MNEQIMNLLTAADPARDVPVAPGDVEALLHRASHDVTGYDLRPPVRRRRFLVAAVAAAAVVAVTGTTAAVLVRGGGQPPAGPPVVPAPSGTPSCLDRLADSAMTAMRDGVGGPYEYLRTAGTSGRTVQMPNGNFARFTYQVETRTWTAEDGSVHRRTINQPPEYADAASRTFFRNNPSWLPHTGTREEDLPAGTPRKQVPAADPAAMAEALYQPRENGPSQAITGVEELVGQRILDREHRIAVLRFLARTDGILCGTEATDPSGRVGVVVTGPEGAGPRPSPGEHGGRSILVSPNTGVVLAAGYTDATGTTWHTVFLDQYFTSVAGAP